jgi:hypothetical protein
MEPVINLHQDSKIFQETLSLQFPQIIRDLEEYVRRVREIASSSPIV